MIVYLFIYLHAQNTLQPQIKIKKNTKNYCSDLGRNINTCAHSKNKQPYRVSWAGSRTNEVDNNKHTNYLLAT